MQLNKLMFVFLLAGSLAHADTAYYAVQSSPASAVHFDAFHGSSKLTGQSTQMSGGATIKTSQSSFSIVGAEFTVPVSSMDMGMGLATKHMNEAIEPASYATINFKVTDAQPSEIQMPAAGAKADVTLHGVWKMHGVSHDISIPASVDFDNAAHTAHVTSSFSLSMKDYNIAAPSLLFFKVNDPIGVRLDLKFTQSAAQ